MTRRTYTPPPDAVYRLGKRKQRATVAIAALRALYRDLAESPRFDELQRSITDIIPEIGDYRKELEV